MQLTLKDGKTYVLHGFPFEDIKEGTVLLENDIAYITYTSVSTKEKIDTKEAERATKEAEAAGVSDYHYAYRTDRRKARICGRGRYGRAHLRRTVV